MLPKFPKFKKLELSDKSDIEAIATQYDPYSDFNFEAMWSWDINDSTKISNLNGNLVLTFTHPITNQFICTYLGNYKVNDSIEILFEFLNKEAAATKQLSLVPEVSLTGIDNHKYAAEIDINSYDYIYDIHQLANYFGNEFIKKRNKTNAFLRNYEGAVVKIIDLKNVGDRKQVLRLNDDWTKKKIKQSGDSEVAKESVAIERFIKAKFKNAFGVGVFHNQQLIGFSIFSFHTNDYVISHFTIADTAYKGAYEFLLRECSSLLQSLGYKYLNYQEDMGVLGLRVAKNSYRPIKFLKKHTIRKL